MKLGWMLGFVVLISASVARAEVKPVKGEDGATIGVLVLCSDCQSNAGKKECHAGLEKGWVDGKPCGTCLLGENAAVRLSSPYTLHFIGKLVDQSGKPVKDRFVKLFMTNGWSVRSRTAEDGSFRLMMGATAPPKSKKPLVTDLGQHVDATKTADGFYSIYLMPDGYKPCSPQAAAAVEEKEKPKHKKH